MTAPITAATVRRTFAPGMTPRWIVTIDADAAEILGVSKARGLFSSEGAALAVARKLQAQLNAAYKDAVA